MTLARMMNRNRLFRELREQKIDYIIETFNVYNTEWWYRVGLFSAPFAEGAIMNITLSFLQRVDKSLYNRIIRLLFRKKRYDLLDIKSTLEIEDETLPVYRNDFHYSFVLFEAIRREDTEAIDMVYSKLDLSNHRHRHYQHMLQLLVEEFDTSLFLRVATLIEDKSKEDEEDDNYVVFKSELFEFMAWDEDSFPLTNQHVHEKYMNRLFADPSFSEYIHTRQKHRRSYQMSMTDLYYDHRQRMSESHSAYIITQMCLDNYLQKDVLQYIIRDFIEYR